MLNNKIILPSSFFAPPLYYSILFNSPDCIIDVHEHYIKQSVRSRFSIYAANGKLDLSVPKIRKKSSKTKMKDIQICYAEPWQKKHWKSITSCYNSSPFFEYYKDKFENIFKIKEKYLIDLNNKSLDLIMQILKADRNINFSTQYQSNLSENDFRSSSFKSKNISKYDQVFSTNHGFINNLSVIDLIFNIGPESMSFINDLYKPKVK